jgi:hypothetical protein
VPTATRTAPVGIITTGKSLLILLALCFAVPAFAHPVPYRGAIGVMGWNQPFMSDDWITYSFRQDTAVAARAMRFDMPEGRMQFFAPQLDFLAKRWNETNSQANIYLYGAYGALNFANVTTGASLAGVEADAETRKYYVSVRYEKMWASRGPDFYDVQARVGAAPYEAEFSEVASWFMIQYQYHPMLVRKFAITPLVRLFYRNVLLEAGASTEGDWMLNYMFHF